MSKRADFDDIASTVAYLNWAGSSREQKNNYPKGCDRLYLLFAVLPVVMEQSVVRSKALLVFFAQSPPGPVVDQASKRTSKLETGNATE